MFDKRLFFVEENRGFDELEKRALEFGESLKIGKISEIEIFLSSTFDFCAALFGALSVNCAVYILAKPKSCQHFYINNETFPKFGAKSEQDHLLLDEKSEFFVSTSGSSGKSKNIKKTLGDMLNEANFLKEFLNLKGGEQLYSSASHQHMFGLTFKIFVPLVSGAKINSTELNCPELIVSKELKNAFLVTSPVVLKALTKSKDMQNLRDLSMLITAGSKLEEGVREELGKFCKAKVMEIYGSTETGVVARNFGDGFEIFDGVDVGFGDDGRLLINSKWCDNFLSSDIGVIEQNRLVLLGRFDRIIKLNDRRFSLDGAEVLLKSHEFVDDARCGLRDGHNRISCIITLSDRGKEVFRDGGKNAIVNSLKEHIRGEFGTNIRQFKIVSLIPLNSQGKFTKACFEALFDRQKKPEFRLVYKDEKVAKFSASLDVDEFFYEGHFANFPLTPGFIQLGFVMEALESLGIDTSRVKSVENLKFKSFLRVFDEVSLRVEFGDNKAGFELFAGANICSSGRIKYE